MRWAIVLAACAGTNHAGSSPRYTLDDLGWLQGTWHSQLLDSHWQTVAGALYGVAFNDHGFEVNIIDDSDDDGKPAPITLVSIENGRNPVHFQLRIAKPTVIELSDPKAGTVNVVKVGDGWRGEFTAPGQPTVAIPMEPGVLAQPPELLAADREFAADTAAKGPEGWVAHFAPDGAMSRGDARIEGTDAIRAAITNTLSRGSLRWQPISTGARGDFGFTLGTFTFGTAHGSYCTIWKKQTDGSWKVVFDIGRPG